MSSDETPLSNEEIRRRLTKEFKVDCGPVTASTRKVLLNKLNRLERATESSLATSGVGADSGNGHHRDDTPPADVSISQVDDSLIINGNGHHDNTGPSLSEPLLAGDSGPRTPRRNSPRRYSPRRKAAEKMDAINTFNDVSRHMKRQSTSAVSTPPPKVSTPKNVRKAIIHTVSLNDSTVKLNQYSSSENSESEDEAPFLEASPAKADTPSPVAPVVGYVASRVGLSNFPRVFKSDTPHRQPLSRPPIRRSTVGTASGSAAAKNTTLLNYSDSESDPEDLKNDKLCKMLLSHRPGLGRPALRKKTQSFSLIGKVKSLYASLKSKCTPSSATDSSASLNFSASSNFISFALLFFVIIFFVGIFSVYFYAKITFNSKHTLDLNDYSFIEDKSKLVAPICDLTGGIKQDCLEYESDRKPALNVVKEIKGFIDQSIHNYYCESSKPLKDISSFNFKIRQLEKDLSSTVQTVQTADRHPSLALQGVPELFARDFANAKLLIKLNPSWNLEMPDDIRSFDDGVLQPTPAYTLTLPLKCNVSLFLRAHLWPIVASSVTLLVSAVAAFVYREKKKAAGEEHSLVLELIDKSIELLQSPDEPQSMPVLHIRDTLLDPSERKSAKYRRVWSKVVAHIEGAESRVKVEYKKIDGEDFKAWKWIAVAPGVNFLSSDNETDSEGPLPLGSQTQKIGGVEWQGMAFGGSVLGTKSPSTPTRSTIDVQEGNESLAMAASPTEIYRNKNFSALTRFLKIRNIFEKEAQYLDPNWTKKIKNTILEKTAKDSPTGAHDIVHIEIEDNPSEGLVYLKCASLPAATNAFHALHGWWCEKKLVSVKFLKEDRYYQRFPAAKRANTPLAIESVTN